MRFEVEDGIGDVIDEVARETIASRRFLGRAWFRAAVEAFELRHARTLAARRDDGRAILALPLVSAGPIRGVRQVPGSYWPFRSFPTATVATVEEVREFLMDRRIRTALGPVWRVGPVYENDPTLALFIAACGTTGWRPLSRRIATNFEFDLGRATLNGQWPRASTLKRIRYLEKQLAIHGSVEWRFVRGSQWSADVIAGLAIVESKSWVGTKTDGSAAKFLAPASRRFWEKVIRDAELSEQITAAIAYVAGEPVAFSLDVESGTTKHVIANSFDDAFAKCSPGRSLAYRNLLDASSRGIRQVDWGAGDSGYKQALGAKEGPEIIDVLFIRGRYFGAVLSRLAQLAWSPAHRVGAAPGA